MHRTNARSAAGFTLLELLLSLAITATLLFATTAFLYVAVSARVQGQGITEVDTQGAAALSLITQTIRNATGVVAPTDGSAASLSLSTSTPALNPTIFQLTGNTLELVQNANPAIPLTGSHVTVSDLTFTNLSRGGTPGLIRVQFTIARRSTVSHAAYSYQKTFTASAALRQP